MSPAKNVFGYYFGERPFLDVISYVADYTVFLLPTLIIWFIDLLFCIYMFILKIFLHRK